MCTIKNNDAYETPIQIIIIKSIICEFYIIQKNNKKPSRKKVAWFLSNFFTFSQ
jgi:hypothetical protein